MSGVAMLTADELEALLLARWYDLDVPLATTILDAVGELADRELLDRPYLLTGAVLALELVTPAARHENGDRARMLERFSSVAQAATSRGRGRLESTQWLLIRMIAARWRGDLDHAFALSQRLARTSSSSGVRSALLDDDHEVNRPGQVALQRGLTELLIGRTRSAMTLFADAYRAGGRPPHRHFAATNGAANAAMVAALEGHDASARQWLDRVGEADDVPVWCRDLTTLGATVARLVLATDDMDLDAASGWAASLDAAGDRFELWPFQLYALTEYDLARGATVSAYMRLRHAGFERNIMTSESAIADHIVFRAHLDALIAAGEGGLVLRLAEDAGTPLRALVPIARTRLLAGDDSGAAGVAARAMRRVLIPERDMWEATVVHAIARMRQGMTDAALRSFATVIAGAPHSLPAILSRQQRRDVDDLYALAGIAPPPSHRHSGPMPSEIVSLTERERRVLQHLVDGLNAAQIAAVDVTSEHTVRTHMKRIYRKLGVSSREDAIACANQQGLVRWAHLDGKQSAPL